MEKYHEELMLYASLVSAAIILEDESDEEIEEIEVRKRKCWVKDWRNSRDRHANYRKLMRELQSSESKDFKNLMDVTCFKNILSMIKKDIKKQNTLMRDAVPASERLAVTLRFLTTGGDFEDLDSKTKLSSSFLRKSVFEVCEAIYKNMKDEHLKFPPKLEEWTKIADDYEHLWQFPLCVGTLGVKHIRFQTFKKDALLFKNYHGFTSIALLGLADAHGKFIFIDIGCNGSMSDEEVLNQSDLMSVLRNTDKYLPPQKVVGNGRLLPHVIVADDRFTLRDHIMTPYPYESSEEWKHTFNERLNRARQSVRSFDILFNRFKILQGTMKFSQQKLKTIVQCCCVLHNYLMTNSNEYPPDGDNYYQTSDNGSTCRENGNSSTRFSESASEVRQAFAEYFANEGKFN